MRRHAGDRPLVGQGARMTKRQFTSSVKRCMSMSAAPADTSHRPQNHFDAKTSL